MTTKSKTFRARLFLRVAARLIKAAAKDLKKRDVAASWDLAETVGEINVCANDLYRRGLSVDEIVQGKISPSNDRSSSLAKRLVGSVIHILSAEIQGFQTVSAAGRRNKVQDAGHVSVNRADSASPNSVTPAKVHLAVLRQKKFNNKQMKKLRRIVIDVIRKGSAT